MTLEEIKALIIEKLTVDRDNLEMELLDNCLRHGRFINLLADHRIESKVLANRLLISRRKKWMYYSGRSDEPYEFVLDKTEIKMMLETDSDCLRIQSQADVNDVKIKQLEDACKSFINRGFNLKSAVEMRKIELGLM
ncbi:recombination protein [Paraglaciecola Antarctic GD virus 1]|nr:recombination protein [Paraglaciecola Antarctic GD virus 1]